MKTKKKPAKPDSGLIRIPGDFKRQLRFVAFHQDKTMMGLLLELAGSELGKRYERIKAASKA